MRFVFLFLFVSWFFFFVFFHFYAIHHHTSIAWKDNKHQNETIFVLISAILTFTNKSTQKKNKWTITFLATFVAAVFLPFCWSSSFSHILQSAHQDETNTFSMILLMHSIIFRINAVKYEVCNKIFIDNHYRLMQTIKTTTKNQQQKKQQREIDTPREWYVLFDAIGFRS